MNERINELALEADISRCKMANALVPSGFIYLHTEETLKRFAELIIADCYSVIIKSQRGHFNPATSWDAVKQHFGVKE